MAENPFVQCLDLPQTPKKPRQLSMNLCLDDGMGLQQTADVISVVGHVIDEQQRGA